MCYHCEAILNTESGHVSGINGMIRRSTGYVIGAEICHLRLAGHVIVTATGKLVT